MAIKSMTAEIDAAWYVFSVKITSGEFYRKKTEIK